MGLSFTYVRATTQLFETFAGYNSMLDDKDAGIAAGAKVPKRLKNFKRVLRGIMAECAAKVWLKANWLSKKLKHRQLGAVGIEPECFGSEELHRFFSAHVRPLDESYHAKHQAEAHTGSSCCYTGED